MTPAKRKLKLADVDAITAEVRQLRKGYTQAGNWTLPQVCWHLDVVLKRWTSNGPPPPPALLPEADKVLAKVLAEWELPKINAPEAILPPATATDADVDRYLESLERFKSFRGPFAPHRLFGPIPFDDFMRLHHIHAGHHLGYLIPTAAA
jgi:hypothetical protein